MIVGGMAWLVFRVMWPMFDKYFNNNSISHEGGEHKSSH